MDDVTVHRESAEKIAPDLAQMCLTIGRETVVDQSEMQCLNVEIQVSPSLIVYFNAISYHSGVRMVQK